ncbi:sialidase family protein [Arundinibacter roseus]|uniref:Exo-alpha-sialidase n=1 Tax=Arundinibacter roseus TaxID=2070510 RepID=A0A4V2X8Z4_9BACT|nr:exo-alpha-sialidase [Arundinibacter roseus]TDB61765.1 exo-alpha-sialidase [Arundinibacter roseus]
MIRIPFLLNRLLILVLLCAFFTAGAQQTRRATPILRSALIFPEQSQHVHGSSLVHLPNGDVLVAWFQGSGERTADDVRIMGARLKKGSQQWSEPFLMADTPHLPDCNPVLFLNHEKKLFLVWIAVQANQWEQSILRLRTSVQYDGTEAPVWNWQDDILLKPTDDFAAEVKTKLSQLPEHGTGWAGYAPEYDKQIAQAATDPVKRSIGWMTRIKPLLLGTTKIVLPLYSDGFNLSLMAISEDDGSSWKPGLPLVGRGPIQPALARKKDGTLVAFLRDSGDYPPRVQMSESTDEGYSWLPARKTDIPNTASVELLVLKNGHWAFVGNDLEDGRYRLGLFISKDEGKSWIWKTYLEDRNAEDGGFSYPSLTQSADGLLHVTYSFHPAKNQKSIKYVVVDPARIINE